MSLFSFIQSTIICLLVIINVEITSTHYISIHHDGYNLKSERIQIESRSTQEKELNSSTTAQDNSSSFISLFSSQFVRKVEPRYVWNDSIIPRFVTYGDSHVDNNTLGVPDPTVLSGLQYYNIAFWTSENGAEDNVQEWTLGSDAQRTAIVQSYNDAGIRLGISVFGSESKPQSSGEDPIDLANKIADFVVQYSLQGVDVDYEEYDLFEQSMANSWLIPFTRQLRSQLLRKNGYYLSHAPIAPLFNTNIYPQSYTLLDEEIGIDIDFYNVQYYNQGGAYSTCQTLVYTADGGAPNTSILELTSVWGINMTKVVAGKPARSDDAANGDGYMDPSLFASCLAEANTTGWNAGAMWWEYRGDIQFVLEPVIESMGVSNRSL